MQDTSYVCEVNPNNYLAPGDKARLLKHWKKVRVELSGEGAGYDVTRGYNQAKVKTARLARIRNQLPLSRSGHCSLSLSEHVVACTRVLVLGRNSGAQQPAALHDIIIIALLSPPIIYCTKSQEIYLSPVELSWWGSQRGFQLSTQGCRTWPSHLT